MAQHWLTFSLLFVIQVKVQSELSHKMVSLILKSLERQSDHIVETVLGVERKMIVERVQTASEEYVGNVWNIKFLVICSHNCTWNKLLNSFIVQLYLLMYPIMHDLTLFLWRNKTKFGGPGKQTGKCM